MAALPPEVALEVRDILAAPPTINPYESLKAALLGRIEPTEQKRMQQLLIEELGDQTPSQLLRRMKHLHGGSASTDQPILRQLFLQRLPTQVQGIIAVAPQGSLDDLASMADRIMASLSTTVSAVQRTPPTLQTPAVSDRLAEKVEHLTRVVEQLSASSHERSRSQQSTARPSASRPSRVSSPSRDRDVSPTTGICWYHSKFQGRAHKCISPCSFSGNEGVDRR